MLMMIFVLAWTSGVAQAGKSTSHPIRVLAKPITALSSRKVIVLEDSRGPIYKSLSSSLKFVSLSLKL